MVGMKMGPQEIRDERRGLRSSVRALAVAVSFAVGGAGFLLTAPSPASAQTSGVQSKAKAGSTNKNVRSAPAARPNVAPVQKKAAPKGFVETIMQGPRFTTTPPEAANWVRASRPAANAAAAPPRRPGPGRAVLTPDQIRAQEAQLDSLRARHDRIAGRRGPSGKLGSAAGKPEPSDAEKHKPGCVLTCSTAISVPPAQRR
jgi:hypothetical protein